MRKNKFLILGLCLLLSACSTTDGTQISTQAEYEAMVPFESSDTRVKHVGLVSDMNIRIEMEQGLMDLSKNHFAPGDVGFRTHQFLDYDTLDATDGSRGLLGTNRDDNPNGLNPSREEEFDTGNGMVKEATVLLDIYELDFYKGDNLKGISLGLVVSDELEGNDGPVAISEKVIKNYIEVASNKLVSYMRERFNEIGKNTPIYVAAYQLNHTEEDSNGSYIYEGYFDKNQSTFSNIEEDWESMPSSSFAKKDPKTSEEFTTFQQDVASVLPDQTYVIGKAKYEKNKLSKVSLTITANGKTASEILAVCQTIRHSMDSFSNTDCMYNVKLYNENELYAMIQRLPGSKETTIISIL